MKRLLLGLTIFATLSGCALRSPTPVEAVVPAAQESVLSGSPCLDGLFANMEERCEVTMTGIASQYGEYVGIFCQDPLPQRPGDALYEGYTELLFRVYDNDNLEYIPEYGVAYFCQDTVVTVGFEIPTE